MSTPPLNPASFRFPFDIKDQPKEVQQAHVFAFNKMLDLDRAIIALKSQISVLKPSTGGGSSSSTSTSLTQIINGSNFPGLGAVRDETGSTSYTPLAADNGILLILNDASPIAVTLNSAMVTPYFLFANNAGAGLVTFTPTTGLINGAATFTLLTDYTTLIVFDGTNWKVTSAQFSIADIAGLVTALAAKAPIASPTFTGTITQPDATVLTAATVAATATAGAGILPITPQQFLTVSINGSSYKIPLYLP